jgi:hypothetical protein
VRYRRGDCHPAAADGADDVGSTCVAALLASADAVFISGQQFVVDRGAAI